MAKAARCFTCGGRLGMIVHRWRDKRFCSDTRRTQCRQKYLEERLEASKRSWQDWLRQSAQERS
jgi:hypothetical protein